MVNRAHQGLLSDTNHVKISQGKKIATPSASEASTTASKSGWGLKRIGLMGLALVGSRFSPVSGQKSQSVAMREVGAQNFSNRTLRVFDNQIDWRNPLPVSNGDASPASRMSDLGSGRAEFVADFDNSTIRIYQLDSDGQLGLATQVSDLNGDIDQVASHDRQMAVLSGKRFLKVFEFDPDTQQMGMLASMDLLEYFNIDQGGAGSLVLGGDRVVVSGYREDGYQAIVVLDREGDRLTKRVGALVFEPGEDPVTALSLEGDLVVVANSEKAQAILLNTAENRAFTRVTDNNLCVGDCVNTLLIGDRIYQASEGALQIYRTPTDSAEFVTGHLLTETGQLFIADGAKIMGMERLDDHTLQVLKDYDKLIIVDVSDSSNPTVRETITINHLKENGFTAMRLAESSVGVNGVMLAEGAQSGLFSFTANGSGATIEPEEGSPVANKPTDNDEGGLVDLTPYLSEDQERGRKGKGAYIAAFGTAAVVGSGATALDYTSAYLGGPMGLNMDAYQGTAFAAYRNIPVTSNLLQVAAPWTGTAVSAMASLRAGLFLNKLSQFEEKVDDLIESTKGFSRFIQSDEGLGEIAESVSETYETSKSWITDLVGEIRNRDITADQIMTSRGIHRFLDNVEKTLLKSLDVSDLLDDVDLLLELGFNEGVLGLFTNLFESIVGEVFSTGYDGNQEGSFTEESVAAAINHAIRSTTNSRLMGRIIAEVLIDSTRLTIRDGIDQVIRNQARLDNVVDEFNQVVSIIEDRLIPQADSAITNTDLLVHRVVSNIKDATRPITFFMLSSLVGLAGQGIASVLFRNLHSLASLASSQAGLVALDNSNTLPYDRLFDSMLTVLSAGVGVGFAQNIRNAEKEIGQTVSIAEDLIGDIADILDSGLDLGEAVPDTVAESLQLLREIVEDVSIKHYSESVGELLSSRQIFERKLEANDPADIGPNVGYIAEGMIHNLADKYSDEVVEVMESVAQRIDEFVRNQAEAVLDQVFAGQVKELQEALPYFKEFIALLSENLRVTGSAVGDLGDNITDPRLAWIEYVGVTLAITAMVFGALMPVKRIAQNVVAGFVGSGGNVGGGHVDSSGNVDSRDNGGNRSRAVQRSDHDAQSGDIEMGRDPSVQSSSNQVLTADAVDSGRARHSSEQGDIPQQIVVPRADESVGYRSDVNRSDTHMRGNGADPYGATKRVAFSADIRDANSFGEHDLVDVDLGDPPTLMMGKAERRDKTRQNRAHSQQPDASKRRSKRRHQKELSDQPRKSKADRKRLAEAK